MGRLKAGQLRLLAIEKKWLEPGAALPDDATLTELFDALKRAAAGPSSSLERHRDRIKQWVIDGINRRVVHRVLMVSHVRHQVCDEYFTLPEGCNTTLFQTNHGNGGLYTYHNQVLFCRLTGVFATSHQNRDKDK